MQMGLFTGNETTQEKALKTDAKKTSQNSLEGFNMT